MKCSVGEFQEARSACGESCPLSSLDPERLKVVTGWLLAEPVPLDASDAETRPSTTEQNLGVRCLARIWQGSCTMPELTDTVTLGEN